MSVVSSNQQFFLLLTQSLHKAGLGIFAGKFFRNGEQVGRVGDAAFPTVDQDFHNSPESHRMEKEKGDYHWPFTNYDWDAPTVGCGNEANDIAVTVPGFGGEFVELVVVVDYFLHHFSPNKYTHFFIRL